MCCAVAGVVLTAAAAHWAAHRAGCVYSLARASPATAALAWPSGPSGPSRTSGSTVPVPVRWFSNPLAAPYKKRVKARKKERMRLKRERLQAQRAAREQQTAAQRPVLGPVLKLHPPVGTSAADPAVHGPMFAVVELQGRQHKVLENDLVMLDRYPAAVADRLLLSHVLLLGTPGFTVVGRPLVAGASVHATVEEHTELAKILSFKKRRRKNKSARMRGSRPPVTVLRINRIEYPLESLQLQSAAAARTDQQPKPAQTTAEQS